MCHPSEAQLIRRHAQVNRLNRTAPNNEYRRVRITGGSGLARMRKDVKSEYSAGEWLKAPVSNES